MDRYISSAVPCSPHEREILTNLMEECAEVISAASKVLRFGKDDSPPKGGRPPNLEHLSNEVGHMIYMTERCMQLRLVEKRFVQQGILEKRKRLEQYMQTQVPVT